MYENDESVDAFVCMSYTGGSEDEDENNGNEFHEYPGDLDDIVVAILVLIICIGMHNLIQGQIQPQTVIVILSLIVIAVCTSTLILFLTLKY